MRRRKFNYDRYLEAVALRKEIDKFCADNNIVDFSLLFDYVAENRWDWFKFLVDHPRCTSIIIRNMKIRYRKLNGHD